MGIENLYEKPKKDAKEAEELAEAIEQSSSLKPEWAERFAAKEREKLRQAIEKLEKMQNASNDENRTGRSKEGNR